MTHLKYLAFPGALVALLLAGMAAPAHAHPLAGIVRDRAGNVYYSDLERVWQLSPAGKKRVVVSGVHTHELWLDAAGNLYGEHLWYEGEKTDKWRHYVWKRAPDGRVIRVFPAREGFRSEWSFVRDAAENGYWAVEEDDGRVEIRRQGRDGRTATVARGRFGDLRWMAADADGTLFFTALADRMHDLYRVSRDGKVVRLARDLAKRGPLDRLIDPRHDTFGLWPDRRGGAYVTILGERQVVHVGADGKVKVILRSPPRWGPTGGLLAPDGSLWILEGGLPGRARVRRIDRDGKSRVFD